MTAFQYFLNRLSSLWLRMRGIRLIIHGQEHLQGRTGPLVIVSNHVHAADAFYIGVSLPRAILPIRFLGARRFKTPFLFFLSVIGLIPIFYKLSGVITVKKGAGIEHNLKKPIEILKNGGVIFIFPEGTRNTSTEPLLPLRRGAAVLAIQAHTPIVPIGIHYDNPEVRVTIGEPFALATADYNEGTATIRERLMHLLKIRTSDVHR